MSIPSRSVSVCAAFAVALLSLIPSEAAAQTSSISGIVTNASGTPIAGVDVSAYSSANMWMAGARTDANGIYTINGLTDGAAHYVATRNQQGFVDETWNNIYCLLCQVSRTGAAIVTTGAVNNINFALDLGARFSGTITDGTNPIAGVSISMLDASGRYSGHGYTAADGTFTTTAAPAGSYRFHTYNVLGFIDQAYGGIMCAGCPTTTGTQVAAGAPGSITSGVNFTLNPGKQFGGRITDSTGNGLMNQLVWMYDTTGKYAGNGLSGVDGSYVTQAVLPGSYRLRTYNRLGYINEVYDNFQCVGCATTAGPLTATGAAQVTPGIDFALELGGTISATITSDGGAPLANVTLQIFNAAGVMVAGSTTDASGVPQGVEGLPSDTYYVRTYNNIGYLDEIYDGIHCPACTIPGPGTAIAVVQGSTNNISITLTLGARLTGVVTGVGGVPLANVNLTVYTAAGQIAAGAVTAGDGSYSTGGLVAGSYLVRTNYLPGHVAQVYDGITCMACPPTTGTLITVALAELRTGINFALTQSGMIQGTVTGTGGAPLSGVIVGIYDASGMQVPGTSTLANGTFVKDGLLPGTYYVRTVNSLGYFDQLHSGISCGSGCAPTSGTPVIVTAGSATPVNFSLTLAGRITGAVSGPSGGVSGVTVEVYTATGTFVRSAVTSAVAGSVGNYTIAGLATGSYLLRTRNSQGLQDEVYTSPDTNSFCIGCQVATVASTPVAVTAGATTPNVNFALTQGGFITGRITDAVTGNGVANAPVSLSGISIATSSTSLTNATGHYTTTGLPSGTYVVRYTPNSTTLNFAGQIYNGVVCAGCSNADGTPITVTLGSETPNINMALAHGGHISGVITNAVTAAPLSNIQVDIVNSAGGTFLSAVTNAAGVYTTATAPVGSYFVKTRMSVGGTNQGYVNEVFNDIACIGCNPTLGAPVAVTVDATTPNINFALVRGSRISGTVTDGAAPLTGQTVQIFTGAGQFVATVPSSDAAGAFRNLEGLTPGTYFARVIGTNGYFAQLHGGTNCYTTCAPTAGTPITVSAGSDTIGVNFALSLGGRISGTVNDAGSGAAIPGVSVAIFNSAGIQVGSGSVTSGGTFITGALQTGTYRAITTNGLGYINQSFGGGDYLGTDLATTGTPIDVVLGATTSGVAFTLSRGARISGTITGAGGAPLRNVTVEFWTAPFTRRAAVATTNLLGQYTSASGLAAGNYTVVTANNLGYVNEIWNGSVGSNIACVLDCSPGSGAAVAVAGTATTSGIDFALDLDADSDTDGINNTIDKNLGSGADESSVVSNDFSDTQIGGRTAGAIADRGGFNVAVFDLSSSGVRATATGPGSSDVRMTVCAVGAAEEVRLRAANDSAVMTCAVTTGSTNAFALVAATKIELRKTIGAVTTIVEIGQGQGATLGSPAAANVGNTESISVRIVDALTGAELGSYTLDPGEAAEATADAQGNITVEVVSGAVTATVRGETVTIGEGAAQIFVSPDTTAPVITTPGNISAEATSAAGAAVSYVVTAADNVDGTIAATCSPASGSTFSIGTTTVGCSATDAHGNTGIASFTVTVAITAATSGSMHGQGVVSDGDDYHFTFHVKQGQTGGENNRFSMNVNHGKQKDKFDSASVDSIVFTGNAVVFFGRGRWNGSANHTFEVRTADLGEPGKGRETVSIVIKDASGLTVATVSGVLASGNIQKVK